VEVFSATLQAEVLERQHLADLVAAPGAVAYATYYNYHRRRDGEIGWHTPAACIDGTPFTDRDSSTFPCSSRWPRS
jgi:hypothetical protein